MNQMAYISHSAAQMAEELQGGLGFGQHIFSDDGY